LASRRRWASRSSATSCVTRTGIPCSPPARPRQFFIRPTPPIRSRPARA